jgi:queuosine precursor transporter
MSNAKMLGWIGFILFCLMVPLSNWLIMNVGTSFTKSGIGLIPVWPWPYLDTASGVLAAGLAFVLRDFTQRYLGLMYSLLAIAIGAVLSYVFTVGPTQIIIASVAAFVIAESIDTAVYTPLMKRGFFIAAIGSSLVGMVVDSIVFLQLGLGNLKYLPGQVVAKAYMVGIAVLVIWLLRKHLPEPDVKDFALKEHA